MIAADTSTWIAFLEGGDGEDARLLDKALGDRQVVMVPIVLTELLSDPKLPSGIAETLSEIPLIEIESGYWQRAGKLRARVLAKRRKARLGDALIAQSCVDRAIPSSRAIGTFGRLPKLQVSILCLGPERNDWANASAKSCRSPFWEAIACRAGELVAFRERFETQI